MARYAVAGATGQIGSEVVRLLDAAGEQVRALVRDTARARAGLPGGVALVEGDMRDEQAQRRLLEGVDALFVVSSDPTAEPPIYRMAGALGVPLVVKSSAIGFGSEPPAGHARAEAALRSEPVASSVLRPNSFMQTLRSYLPRVIDADGTFGLPAGEGASAWVDTRDIAGLGAHLLRSRPEDAEPLHLVTGPRALTMSDVATIVSEATGQRLRYRPLSTKEALPALDRRLGPMGAFLAEHYAAVSAGGFAAVSDSVSRVLERPARSLEALVEEDVVAWTAAER